MAARKPTPPEELEVDPATGEIVPAGSGVAVPDQGEAPVTREGDLGLEEYLITESAHGEPTPEQSYRMIIDQILSSETPEDVLVPVEAVNARELLGEPFSLVRFDINRSDFEVGSPWYASMNVILLKTDERMVLNTGNQAILAQLVRLSQLDAFPQTCTVVEGKRPNRFGTKPIRLKLAEAPRKPQDDTPGF